MAANPKWTRDELILALDLYFKVSPLHNSENHPDVVGLSELLNKLPADTHPGRTSSFRNRNGVYMKLCNFLRLDPSYQGEGLAAGSKLDEVVWKEFAGNRKRLEETALAIRKAIGELKSTPSTPIAVDDEFPEGRVLTRLHTLKERSASLIAKKKEQVLQVAGALKCEVCGFDFAAEYGEIGKGFAECHHLTPLSELDAQAKTKLSDLAIVCANCHRMLHRARPWMSIKELRSRHESIKKSG